MSVYLRQGEDKSENGFTSVALLNTSLQRERDTNAGAISQHLTQDQVP